MNYKFSFLAMIICQIILFNMELSVATNVVAYIVNLVGWIVVGALLECILAVMYGIDLTKMKYKK